MVLRQLKILVYNVRHNRDFIMDYLKALRHTVYEVSGREDFAQQLILKDLDVVIIDMEDGPDKFFLLDYLKENAADIVAVMLTEDGSEADKIEAYRHGTDIYASMPVNMQELMYRIAVVDKYMRSGFTPADSKKTRNEVYELGNYTLDCTTMELLDGNGCPIVMPYRFVELLKFLVRYPGSFIPKTEICRGLYGGVNHAAYNSMTSDISRLRKYMRYCTMKIKTISKLGYRFERTELSDSELGV